MTEFIDCPHCGKQGVIQGYEGERCLFCGKLLKPEKQGGKMEKRVDCGFQRLRGYPDCYEDCPDTSKCPVNVIDLHPIPLRPKTKDTYEISRYYEENKEAILADLDTMGEKPMCKRWKISQATWDGLKCRWRPQIYGPGKSKTHRTVTVAVTQKEKPKRAKPVSAEYFAGYQQAVKDGAPRVIKGD